MVDTWLIQEMVCSTGLTVFAEMISVFYINCLSVNALTLQPQKHQQHRSVCKNLTEWWSLHTRKFWPVELTLHTETCQERGKAQGTFQVKKTTHLTLQQHQSQCSFFLRNLLRKPCTHCWLSTGDLRATEASAFIEFTDSWIPSFTIFECCCLF